MSSLMRAKAALLLVVLLSIACVAPVAQAAPILRGAQQAVGIVALRHAVDGAQTRIILEGTTELPYTIYRPNEQTILVDLPGVDASRLEEEYAVGSRGVERIQVERLRTASGQSLARLRIHLVASVEDRTIVEGKNLVLTLTTAAAAPVASAAAPAPERAPTLRSEASSAPKKSATPVVPVATRPEPAVPTHPASVITGVRTEVVGSTFHAYIATDGRAPIKHFVLPNPDRVVLDIEGVSSKVDRNALEVNQGGVARIRIGQFRTNNPRIVRVVFDIKSMGTYDVRQVGNDLVFSMGTNAAGPVPPAPSRTDVARSTPERKDAAPPAERRKSEAEKTTTLPPPVVPKEVAGESDDRTAEKDAPEVVKPVAEAPTKVPERTEPVAKSAPTKPVAGDPARNPGAMSAPVRNVAANTRTLAPAPAPTAPRRASNAQPAPPGPVMPQEGDETGYLTPGFVGRPVNLDLKNVDLRDLLRFLHNTYNVNFIVDKSVPGSVPIDVNIKNVPWNQALDTVLKSQGLGAVREGEIVRIATLPSLAQEREAELAVQRAIANTLPLVTKIFKLKYASPIPRSSTTGAGGGGQIGGGAGGDPASIRTGIIAFIRNRLSPRGRIEVDIRSNSVIVTDLPQHLEVVEQIIRVIDKPEPQVEIEARIVIARRSFVRDLGVQLSAVIQNPSRGGLIDIESLPGGAGTGLNSGFPLVSLTTGTLGTFQISAFIIAAERKGHIRTIAAPRVTTQNNTTAEIVNGVQIPVQTISNNTVTTTFVDAALRLNITPQIIIEDGAVLLSVIAENNDVSDLRTVGGTPGINTQSARSIVLVPDGGTTVLGGINIDLENQTDERTPGLARIPIIGNLFKRRTVNRDTQEILFFITPRIFRPELVGLPQESTIRANDVLISPLPAGSTGVGLPDAAAPGGFDDTP